MEWNLINFWIFFFILYTITTLKCNCLQNRDFINASKFEILREKLGLESESEAYSLVTSFLGSCTLASSFAVRGLGECTGRCMSNTQCMAVTYTHSEGCMHCFASEGSQIANGGSFYLDHTMVSRLLLDVFHQASSNEGKSLFYDLPVVYTS